MLTPDILVIDGHDGAGKTSVARLLDPEYGRYVKPFASTLGDHIAWLAARQRWRDLDVLARSAVERTIEEHRDAERVIFDRHWLSMFTLLPEQHRREWYPVPRTVLCWTDLDTTLQRLGERGEAPGDLDEHARYIAAYRALAARYRVPLLDTSVLTPDAAAIEVIRLAGLRPVTARTVAP